MDDRDIIYSSELCYNLLNVLLNDCMYFHIPYCTKLNVFPFECQVRMYQTHPTLPAVQNGILMM